MSLNANNFFLGPSTIDHEMPPPTPESITDFSSDDTESPSMVLPSTPPNSDDVDQGRPRRLKNFVAFGSLRLSRKSFNDEKSRWGMSDGDQYTDFPPNVLHDSLRRGWLQLEQISHPGRSDLGSCRVFLLPEDVERASRSSPKPFRKAIKWLISVVDISQSTWSGSWDENTPIQKYGVPAADREESLFYIFNTLQSPIPGQLTGSSRYANAAMDAILTATIPGIETELYPYQIRSVATMLRREECPTKSQDPRKPGYNDLEGRPFYMDVFDAVILQHPHLYEEPRGGILAETMGYGKTLACIALIAATRGHYPGLPEARIEQAYRHKYEKTPSLLGMAARALRQKGIPWKAEFDALRSQGYHFDRCEKELQKFHAEFGEPIFTPTTPGRTVSKRQSERTLRLSNATLVIVPPNILPQWVSELAKHTHAGALDVLVIDMTVKEMPSWQKLINKDIVLISKNRLDAEWRGDDLHAGKRSAGSDKYSSQLTELRWLRVICDEGHAFASSSSRTKTMAMLDLLSVERRWIISGTPSSSLIGVDVNLATDEVPEAKRRAYMDTALERRRITDSASLAKQEEKDVERLRHICQGYFRTRPWANQKGADSASWNKYLQPFDANGKRRCTRGLRNLLSSLIVRHRIKDIDNEISLPPLHNVTRLLEPTRLDKLSLNLFMTVLASNAVTSERTDEDYIHHPKNRKVLDTLINNLRQATFYWVGFAKEDLGKTIEICNRYLEKQAEKPTVSDEDKMLLRQAISHAEKALADPLWQAFSTLHQMGCYIEDFPKHAAPAWSLTGKSDSPLPLGNHEALALQKYVRSHLCEEDPTSGLIGAGMRAMNEAKKRAESESQKSSKGGKGKGNVVPATGVSGDEASQKPLVVVDEPQIRSTLTRPLSTTSANIATLPSPRKRRRSSIAVLSTSMTAAATETLTKPIVTGFASAKLTYLVQSILAQPPGTKSLIFYEANNTAFWLAEALEIVGIPHLIYSNTLSPAKRAKHLSMFNNDEADPDEPRGATTTPTEGETRWRVLLMDLRQASTGLHCAAASRVYIITPIWRREVEAQAIKRAHRIGQTKEVYCETLVLKDTIEERLWRRRRARSEDERAENDESANASTTTQTGSSIPPTRHTSNSTSNMSSGGWLEDRGVVGIIQNEGFLDIDETDAASDGTEKAARLDGPGVQLFKRELKMRTALLAAQQDILDSHLHSSQERIKKPRMESSSGAKGKGKAVGFAGLDSLRDSPSPQSGAEPHAPPRTSIFGVRGLSSQIGGEGVHAEMSSSRLVIKLKVGPAE